MTPALVISLAWPRSNWRRHLFMLFSRHQPRNPFPEFLSGAAALRNYLHDVEAAWFVGILLPILVVAIAHTLEGRFHHDMDSRLP